MNGFTRKPSRAELTALFAAVAFFACLLILNRVLWGRDGETYHRQLMQEFRSIQPLPGAVLVKRTDHFSSWWPHKALVGAGYTVTAKYVDIRDYYDRELTSRGWHLVEEKPYAVWGNNLGGQLRDYCKGPLEGELEYAGSQPGRTYSLEFSWGSNHNCKQ